MPDQLEELFADLRAETISRIRPPGAAAARTTVRRRRFASGLAVAVAAAAVAGGVAVAAGGRSTPPAPAASRSAGPATKPAAPAAIWPATASEESTFNAGLAADLLTAGGATNLGRATTGRPAPIEVGTFGGGSALLFYACAGPGLITFAVTITPLDGSTPTSFDDELECAADGIVRPGLRRDLPRRSRVTVTAVPDGVAVNHAGWAWGRMPW